MNTHIPKALRLGTLAMAMSAVLALAACGQKDASASGQASQVAAKVGDSEISVHQINQVLSRTPIGNNSKEAVQAASQTVLERLIDQQLAVDQATEQKLHRSPDVVAALEAARREVLARAYLQQITAATPKPSPEDIHRYYQDNPALFAQRRIYTLQEIRVPNAGAVKAELEAMVKENRRMEEIADLLRQRGVVFNGGTATRSAEQLPLDMLPRMHALQDGQSLLVPAGENVTLVRVASSRKVPVTEEAATPGITQFLSNRRATDVVANEIKRLREATTISYVGDFDRASTKTADPAQATPASVTEEKKASDDSSVLERGLQGLK